MGSITERSFGVPEAVISGQYGIGVVVDFFGLSAIASGQPMLCTRFYGRLDLRVRAQPGRLDGCPIGACPSCCAAATVAPRSEMVTSA